MTIAAITTETTVSTLLELIVEEEREYSFFRAWSWNGFTIEEVLSKNAPPGATYFPNRVLKDGIPWWTLKVNNEKFKGRIDLDEYNGECFISLTSKKGLEVVIPIADLPNMQQGEDGEYYGGRKLRQLVSVKEALAKRGGVTPIWTEREQKVRDVLHQQAAAAWKAAREAEEAARLAEREAKERARALKIAELKARKIVYVTIESGANRRGIPVVGDEWQILPPETHCILVTAYNEETGEVEEPIEAFKTVKTVRGKERVMRGKVIVSGTKQKQQTLPKLLSAVHIIDGEIEEIFIASSIDVVREYHKAGLNSGALVAAPEGDPKGRYTVYELRKGQPLKTVTTINRPNI